MHPTTRRGNDLDFSVRGLAHTGFASPLIEEMRTLGAPVDETRLTHAAESFLRTWERAYKRQGALSDAAYRRAMGTQQRASNAPLPAREYDHHLAKLYTECAKLKAEL